jgi:hypothetical protein
MTEAAGTGSDFSRVKIRLLDRSSQKPLTGQVEAVLRSHTKRGLVLELATPYVQGRHIMMDNEGGASPLVETLLPGDDKNLKLAEAVSFYRKEAGAKACFVVELAYAALPPADDNSLVWSPFRRKSRQTIYDRDDF